MRLDIVVFVGVLIMKLSVSFFWYTSYQDNLEVTAWFKMICIVCNRKSAGFHELVLMQSVLTLMPGP